MKNLNKSYTVLDLFAGAGGLSLGFELEGYHVDTAIEIDAWAAETYKNNMPKTNTLVSDITLIEDSYFEKFKGIDLIVGGPPCQGFSIAASNRRSQNDPRNFLYREFLRAVKIARPKIVLVENVKEILHSKLPDGSLLINDFCEVLNKLDYEFVYQLFNISLVGVPQNRIRFFLIAVRKDILKDRSIFNKYFDLTSTLKKDQQTITAWEAISDLPPVIPRMISEDKVFDYDKYPQNKYQELMRGKSKIIYNHVPMRHTQRIIDRFKSITINNSWAELNSHGAKKRGDPKQLSGKIYDQNHRRLDPNKLSPTITASFYSSFIHPFQDRNLTVREAARLQSFPDSFIFYGKRTTLSKKLLAKKGISEDLHLDQFNQVGNSVPPLMGSFLAKIINDYLNNEI